MNQQPIFILGAQKSGTSLLRSILDGHSKLFVIPMETHYFQLAKYWVDFEFRAERPGKISREEIIERFCNWIHHKNVFANPYSDSDTRNMFDEDLFLEAISEIQQNDEDKIQIEKYFEAIYYSIYNQQLSPNKRVVEKSIENAEFAWILQLFFPQAKFIHIIRNPYANIVSIRKFKSMESGFPLMPRIVKSLKNSYYYLYKNKENINNYFTIRYRDLVTNPETQIKRICKFLEIPFEKTLLAPTHLGKNWQGNSITGEPFTKINATRLNKWQNEIFPLEVSYINKLFSFVLKDYNYQKVKQNGSIIKRAKGESIKKYLYNRLYFIYI
jgi:hypothetical protein